MTALLLTNVRVWDGGETAAPGEVLVEGPRVRAVARGAGRIARDRAAEVIDGGGLFLMPGMVEGHCHMSFTNVAQPAELGEIPPEEHVLATARNAELLLDCGFTSVYAAASAKMRLDVVVRNEVNAGRLKGPRIRAAGPEIATTGGLGDERRLHIYRESFALIADGCEEIRKACRLCVREGVDNLKLNISGDDFYKYARAESTPMSAAEIATAVEVARDMGVRVACHARSSESVKRAVRGGVDVIYHCEFSDVEALDLLESRKSEIFVGPAVGLAHNVLFEGERHGLSRETAEQIGILHGFEKYCETYKEIRRRGIRVVIGGDYGFVFTPQGTNARDIGHLVKFFGYTNAEALACATSVGGEIMGLGHELGRVREGHLADLLLVDGDPLQDVTVLEDRARIAMIMKDGALHKDPRGRRREVRLAAE